MYHYESPEIKVFSMVPIEYLMTESGYDDGGYSQAIEQHSDDEFPPE